MAIQVESRYSGEDVDNVFYALEHGWTVEPHPRGRQHDAYRFVNGDVHIWRTSGLNKFVNEWTAADLLDHHYRNHRRYPQLRAAFEGETAK